MLDLEAQLSFSVHAKGPGPVYTVADASNPSKLCMLARQAGVYSLELRSKESQELLGKCALQVSVL